MEKEIIQFLGEEFERLRNGYRLKYQGSKFKNNNNKYYLEFSLDSETICQKTLDG